MPLMPSRTPSLTNYGQSEAERNRYLWQLWLNSKNQQNRIGTQTRLPATEAAQRPPALDAEYEPQPISGNVVSPEQIREVLARTTEVAKGKTPVSTADWGTGLQHPSDVSKDVWRRDLSQPWITRPPAIDMAQGQNGTYAQQIGRRPSVKPSTTIKQPSKQPAAVEGNLTPSEKLRNLETMAKERGISSSTVYSGSAMFPSTLSTNRKIELLSKELGVSMLPSTPTELKLEAEKAKEDYKLSLKEEKEKKAQQGRIDTIIGLADKFIKLPPNQKTFTVNSTGKQYTLDTPSEFIGWLEENGSKVSPEQRIEIMNLNWPATGVDEGAFGGKQIIEKPPAQLSPADIDKEYLRRTREGWTEIPAESPAVEGEATLNTSQGVKRLKPPVEQERPITEEEQLSFAKRKAEATRAPKIPKAATYKEEYRNALKEAVDAVSKGAPIEEVIKMLIEGDGVEKGYPDMMDEIMQFQYYLQENYPAKKVK